MSATLPISIVDVFAEQPFAGNQLAVVHDAADLSAAQMQAIAREMNFSETTFIGEKRAGSAQVRIFTPVSELPFAGHPTIGTAWELTAGQGEVTLELEAGPVPVNFEDSIGWMVPPAVNLRPGFEHGAAAALLGLEEADLDADFPIMFAQVGPRFVIIPVRDLNALKALRVDPDIRRQLLGSGHPVESIFAFTKTAYNPDADYAARMIFDAGGLREDPATGSANAALAAYLEVNCGDLGRVVVEQGFEIARPSRLYLDIGPTLRVGGKVQPILRGEIFIEP